MSDLYLIRVSVINKSLTIFFRTNITQLYFLLSRVFTAVLFLVPWRRCWRRWRRGRASRLWAVRSPSPRENAETASPRTSPPGPLCPQTPDQTQTHHSFLKPDAGQWRLLLRQTLRNMHLFYVSHVSFIAPEQHKNLNYISNTDYCCKWKTLCTAICG